MAIYLILTSIGVIALHFFLIALLSNAAISEEKYAPLIWLILAIYLWGISSFGAFTIVSKAFRGL